MPMTNGKNGKSNKLHIPLYTTSELSHTPDEKRECTMFRRRLRKGNERSSDTVSESDKGNYEQVTDSTKFPTPWKIVRVA